MTIKRIQVIGRIFIPFIAEEYGAWFCNYEKILKIVFYFELKLRYNAELKPIEKYFNFQLVTFEKLLTVEINLTI